MNPVTACCIWAANIAKKNPGTRCESVDFAPDDGPHVLVTLSGGHMQRFDLPGATDADRDDAEVVFSVACGLAAALAEAVDPHSHLQLMR